MRQELLGERQPFVPQGGRERHEAGDIASWSRQAGKKPPRERVGYSRRDDRNRGRGFRGGERCSGAIGYDCIRSVVGELGSELRQQICPAVGPPFYQFEIAAFGIT